MPAKNLFSAFVELTKPRITFLILVSTALGYYLGNQSKIDITLFALTMIGTFFLSGGAGTINHFVEKDLDKLMDRTQARPIPAGIISSKNALVFGVSISIFGFVILAASVNYLTAILGLLTVLLYIFVYTPIPLNLNFLMKKPLCNIINIIAVSYTHLTLPTNREV